MPSYIMAVVTTVKKLEFRRVQADTPLDAVCQDGAVFEEHVLTQKAEVVSDQALELPDNKLSVANNPMDMDDWKGQIIAMNKPKPKAIEKIAPPKAKGVVADHQSYSPPGASR